ncbi:MAG: hypothetical protein AAGA91_19905 [Pseudomonadota bacterium]
MRLAYAVGLLVGLTACASSPEPTPFTTCGEPRPQVCTMQYEPTCGILVEGGREDYSSPCNACAHDTVAAYEPGPCSE